MAVIMGTYNPLPEVWNPHYGSRVKTFFGLLSKGVISQIDYCDLNSFGSIRSVILFDILFIRFGHPYVKSMQCKFLQDIYLKYFVFFRASWL